MESVRIYQESEKELQRIKKSLITNPSTIINFDKLDIETAGCLKTAITEAIASRCKEISKITHNVY